MNVTLMRLKPVIAELRGIRVELQRANDMRERELAYSGLHIKPPVADTSGPDPEVFYTNEEADALRELAEEVGRMGRRDESSE